jgi:hypothetical protein
MDVKHLRWPALADNITLVSIVAVHGLNGDALKTWTTLETGICWLNDPQSLPKYVKNARVLVWGYNASFSSLMGDRPSKDRIHHHAHTLLANLAADRRASALSIMTTNTSSE